MFKRDEDYYLEQAKKHIEKTYEGHYVNDHNIQAVDLWEAQGSLLTTARDTAEKYLMRFGKKNGENLEDLYKAIHFIIMMIHVVDKRRATTTIITKPGIELPPSSCEEVVVELKANPNDRWFPK